MMIRVLNSWTLIRTLRGRPADVKGDNRAHGNRDPGDAGGGVPAARGLPVRGEIPRSIIREPELAAFIEGFGTLPDDHCLVAEVEGTAVGAAWVRIVRTYGHIDDTTPLLSISLLPKHRGQGIGTVLMDRLLDHLRTLGHRRASLSVQKANPALRLYRRAGFVDYREEGDELIMIKNLAEGTWSR